MGALKKTRQREGKRHADLRHAFPVYREGIHHVKDTVKRAEAFWSRAKKHGVTVKEMIWTQGAHDVVVVFEAPDDETASIVILSADELGTVRTETMRGFTLPRWKSYWPRSTSASHRTQHPPASGSRRCSSRLGRGWRAGDRGQPHLCP